MENANPIEDRPFRQANPKDQFTCIIQSIKGHLYNFEEGIIDREKFLNRISLHIIDLERLSAQYSNEWK